MKLKGFDLSAIFSNGEASSGIAAKGRRIALLFRVTSATNLETSGSVQPEGIYWSR